jgi:tetraacyldisaccharide 4'-kinase
LFAHDLFGKPVSTFPDHALTPASSRRRQLDQALMREPAFWWDPDGGRWWLSPISGVYGMAAALRMRSAGRRAGVPVICLGNLTVGGAGKTPAALEVGRILLAAHERPYFLTRGYGGRLAGPVRVDPARHTADAVGDEPLLLARLAPTIVSRNRVAGAEAARRDGATVIVMDDGFQNPSLTKDLAVLLVDGRRGIGNGRVFPAGPLRAPLEAQIEFAHAIIVVGPADGASAVIEAAHRHGVAVFHAGIEPDRATIAAVGRRPVLAFAGIGNPDKFFATLLEAGIAIAERLSFPDHHRYTASDARALLKRADAENVMLLTTEKDAVRLNGHRRLTALASRANTLPVRLAVTEAGAFQAMILNVFAQRGGGASTPR